MKVEVQRDERRSPASLAGRALIREAAVMAHEHALQAIVEPAATRKILEAEEPVVVREVRIADPRLLTMPRGWVRGLVDTLGRAHFVRVDVVGRPKRLRLTGRWSDVQLAELA